MQTDDLKRSQTSFDGYKGFQVEIAFFSKLDNIDPCHFALQPDLDAEAFLRGRLLIRKCNCSGMSLRAAAAKQSPLLTQTEIARP